MVPNPTYIFHMTHFKNLPLILENEGIFANNNVTNQNVNYTNIAHQDLQVRRSTTKVPINPKGYLHDYVPYYFAPRSPMLYSIHCGNVDGYEEGQQPVIYLVSSAQTINDANIPCVFTDGHAIMALSDFYHDLNDLRNVHWETMKSKYWNDTPDYPDRKRLRQAEFLVHEFMPWSLVLHVCTIDHQMAHQTKEIIKQYGYQTPVSVKSKWYF